MLSVVALAVAGLGSLVPIAARASTGCDALNTGALNLTAAPFDFANGTIPGSFTFDDGDKLAITLVNSDTFRLLNGAFTLFEAVGLSNGTFNVTLDGMLPAGNLLAFLQAPAVGAGAGLTARDTITCMPATAGGGGGGTVTGAQKKARLETMQSTLDLARLPTSAGILPYADPAAQAKDQRIKALKEDIAKLQAERAQAVKDKAEYDEAIAEADERIEAIRSELAENRDVLAPKLLAEIESLRLQRSVRDALLSYLSSPTILTGDGLVEALRTETGIDEAEARELARTPPIPQYLEVQDAIEELNLRGRSEVGARSDLRSDSGILGGQIDAIDAKLKPLQAELDDILDPKELGDGDPPLFAPSGDGMEFSISTDVLRDLARNDALSLGPRDSSRQLGIAGMPVNIWAKGRVTALDGDKTGIEGVATSLQVGTAIGVSESLSLGAFATALYGDIESNVMASKMEQTTFGGGLYAQMQVWDSVTLGVSAAYEAGEADATVAGGRGDFDVDRWSLSASVSGTEVIGPLVLRPVLSLDYTASHSDGYVDSLGTVVPASSREDVAVAAGASLSRPFRVDDETLLAVTPFANLNLSYTFRENDSLVISATRSIDQDAFAASVGAGVAFVFAGGAQLSLQAGVLGLNQDTVGYTGQIRFGMRF